MKKNIFVTKEQNIIAQNEKRNQQSNEDSILQTQNNFEGTFLVHDSIVTESPSKIIEKLEDLLNNSEYDQNSSYIST